MKFVIATGGSGGHIFPALYVANELKRAGHAVRFVGVFGKALGIIEKEGFQCVELSARGYSTVSMQSRVQTILLMLKAIFESLSLLRRDKPDGVIGFGGYGAFPVVVAGKILGCATMIHEQNVVPGRANTLLGKIVKRIAISFEKTDQHFSPGKTLLTGCPCRPVRTEFNKSELLRKFGLQDNLFTLLILGGSQGSHQINVSFLKTAPLLKEQLSFQVIHVSGESDCDELKKRYKTLGIDGTVIPFLDEIEDAYNVADLVISRAGAVTIIEIIAHCLRSILIPYPYAGAHQKENAMVLFEKRATELLEESQLTSENLCRLIGAIKRETSMTHQVETIKRRVYRPNAAQMIANEAILLGKS